jgi:PEP-CTERM motif
MTFRKIAVAVLLGATSLVAASASAFATPETFSSAINLDGTPFTLNTFDTSLGTLTGVTLDFTANASLQIDVLNFAYVDAPFITAFTGTTATLTGAGGPISTVLTTQVNNGTLPNYGADFSQFLAAENLLPTANVSNSTSLSIASANFAPFESAGAGTIQYSFDNTLDFTSGGSAGANSELFGGSGSVTGGTLAVTYNYVAAAVPEPTTWAMFLVGFGGVGFMMRGSRRKRAAAIAR